MTGTAPRRRPAPSGPATGEAPELVPAPAPVPRARSAGPGERLAALLAEAATQAASHDSPTDAAGHDRASPPDGPEDSGGRGPAHRWAVSTRTRVPASLLLLAVVGLALLAWTLLGGAPGPDAPDGAVLAEVDAGTTAGTSAADGPEPSSSTVAAASVPSAEQAATAPPRQALAVHVTGEVVRPGVVEVAPDARVVDAVEAAGGLTEHAATSAVNLAAPVADGQQVVVPDARAGPVPPGSGPVPEVPPGAPAGPVNLNTASAVELETLPKVGPVLAGRIVAFRQQQGGFAAVEELDAVPGIGPALLEALLPLVTV